MTPRERSSAVVRERQDVGAWVVKIPRRSRGQRSSPRLLAEPSGSSVTIAEDDRCTVVFAGVLWNGDELASDGRRGERGSAAATTLAAYRRSGESVFSKLRGVFGAVVCDHDTRTLLCVRDPAGAEPLFYADAGDDLLLSSSTEALLRYGSVSTALDRMALADHVLNGHPYAVEETYFAGIKRVPPGHLLHEGPTGRRLYRYWDPVEASSGGWVGEDELERLEEVLVRAVDRALELGPACIHLSGGIDSATVAVLAADRSRRRALPAPIALSVVFPDKACNEELVQRRVASDLRLPQLLTSFDEATGPGRLLASALDLSGRTPAPLLNPFEPAFEYLSAEASRRGCRVLLTGGGGDEWLVLEPAYAVDLLRSFDFVGLFRLWDAKRRYLPLPARSVIRNNVWRAGIRPILRDAAHARAPSLLRAYRRRRPDWMPGWAAPDATLRQELRARVEDGDGEPISGSRHLRAKRRILDHPAETFAAEEASAAGERLGIRRIEPFFDPDVVELLCRVRPELLIAGNREKAPVRPLLRRSVPSVGPEWPKTVFMDSYLASVLRSQGPAVWRRLGGASALAELEVVDGDGVRGFVDTYFAGNGGPADMWRVWSILSAEAWVRARSTASPMC